MRGLLSISVALACLAAPAAASAHARAPAVALDYRLSVTGAPAGVHATVIDGDRDLRLVVDPALVVVVRGLLGEPALRFDRGGVWGNRRSPTAAADRVVKAGGPGPAWVRLTRTHAYMWHDHRLAPPGDLRAGSTAPWSLPLTVAGQPARLVGSFVRVRPPSAWPWIVGALAAIGVLAAVAVLAPGSRRPVATALAALAALAGLAGNLAFATGDAIARADKWLDAGAAAILAIAAVGSLAIRNWSIRGWVVMLVGAVAAALSLGTLSVFWHGVVISSLPDDVARLTTAIAVIAGLVAMLLTAAVDDVEES
jgi:hypothetical protein